MSYNHGAAKRKFETEWQKKEKQYRELGMTEKQISAIREFDEHEFRAERVYLEKKVPLAEADEFRHTTIDESVIDNIEENWYEYITDSERRKALSDYSALRKTSIRRKENNDPRQGKRQSARGTQ